MDSLRDSISRYGILVPLIVYRSPDTAGQLILIDGERRLRCARDLGLINVPVSITSAPSDVENVLMMFNIHGLREQWDPYTIAEALELLMKKLNTKSSAQLSALTGFGIGSINRSKKILRLPSQYREMLRLELAKPKTQQVLTEDFFLEAGDAVSSIRRYKSQLFARYGESELLKRLVDRRMKGAITSIVDLRVISDLANSKKNDLGEREAEAALLSIIEDDSVDLRQLYRSKLERSALLRSTLQTIKKTTERLESLRVSKLSAVARAELTEVLSRLSGACSSLIEELRSH